MEILKQPNNKPNIIELQIFLVALGTLGYLDNVDMKNVKFLISFSCLTINILFSTLSLKVLTYFFRYLNSTQLNLIVENLLKFVFTKTNKLNLYKE